MPTLNKPRYLTSELKTPHAFFTRQGGMTPGMLGGLNCGSSYDTVKNIQQNQALAARSLKSSYDKLTILKQIHSATVHVVEDEALPRSTEGDALVTRTPGMLLGILTADCVPVLLYDAEAKVVAALHAGWKGALYGIVENTVKKMEELGAEHTRIRTAIGPCIHQHSYEVGEEYRDRFMKEDAFSERFFIPAKKEDHFMFDLPGYVAMRLRNMKIHSIADIGMDTRSNPDLFFSCRRAHLQRETGFGNGLSAIMLKK